MSADPCDHLDLAACDKMENIGRNQLLFALHPPGLGEFLDASVFVQKVQQLLRALGAADKAINGSRENAYGLYKLKSSTPTLILNEYPAKRQADFEHAGKSAIAALDRCAAAIVEGDVVTAQAFGSCAKEIRRLSSRGRGRVPNFGYGEIWPGTGNVIRIDPFLERRTIEAIKGEPSYIAGKAIEGPRWFRGVIDGTFEGELQEVDLRGAVPECALVVGPGHQIDCIFRESDLPKIGHALTSRARVRVMGRAIYDGGSGLPARLQISDVEEVSQSGVDFLRWRKSFKPFPLDDWEEDQP